MGNGNCRSTRLGNLLTARTLILLWVLAAKGCWWIVEQPSSSLMEYHVLFQRFLSMIPVRRLSICMADYGGPTLKPTYLYSSHSKLEIWDVPILDSSEKNLVFYQNHDPCPRHQFRKITPMQIYRVSQVTTQSTCFLTTRPPGVLWRRRWCAVIQTAQVNLAFAVGET